MKKRNMKIKILLVILLTISLGYALLTVNLKIEGLGTINSMDWDVHWGNAQVTEGSVTDVKPTINGQRTTATYTFNLRFPGDYYEFLIDAVNGGSKDAMIQTIDNKVYEEDGETLATLPSYIHYSVTYTNGTAVAPNQKLPAKGKKQYKVRVEYDSNTDESPEEDLSYVAEFKVTYKEADENAVNVEDGRIRLIDSEIIEITDQQGNNKQEYLLIGEETVNGVDSYVMVARHNISIYATMPGAVQFLQYDEDAAAKKLGVNHFYTNEYAYIFPEYNTYDKAGTPSFDYDYDKSSPQYVYDSFYDDEYYSEFDVSEYCHYHQETDTGVTYCFREGYPSYSSDTEEEYYSYSHYTVEYGGNPSEFYYYGHSQSTTSNIKGVVEKHKEKLQSMGINVTSARLLSYEEADRIKDDFKDVEECFWLGSAYDSNHLYYFCGFNNTSIIDYNLERGNGLWGGFPALNIEGDITIGIGVRPVIIIPKSEID